MAFTWTSINKDTKINFKEINDLQYAVDFLDDNAANVANEVENTDQSSELAEDVSDNSINYAADQIMNNADNGHQAQCSKNTTSDRRLKTNIVYI